MMFCDVDVGALSEAKRLVVGVVHLCDRLVDSVGGGSNPSRSRNDGDGHASVR